MIKVENKETGINADNNILRNTGARLTFQRFLESFLMKMIIYVLDSVKDKMN